MQESSTWDVSYTDHVSPTAVSRISSATLCHDIMTIYLSVVILLNLALGIWLAGQFGMGPRGHSDVFKALASFGQTRKDGETATGQDSAATSKK